MKPRTKRAIFIILGLTVLCLATTFILKAFNENLVFFYTPTQVANNEAPHLRSFRIGGMVEKGSLKRDAGGLNVEFIVTDTAKNIPVKFSGILPDLFSEGKGVVAQGKLDGKGVFVASQVLAKHDENYMPPEAGAAIKKAQETNSKISHSVITEGSKP
ncbi:MAG: cytochrome c maturation protein CcmE [Betaproteobacteria bacterium]